MTSARRKDAKDAVEVLLLLLLAGWLFGYRLGNLGFWNRHSESRRAEVAREMAASGDWLVPRLNGEVFLTKPPLGYWLMALSFRLTGRVNEWASRLPSAICGWWVVLLTYLMGRWLWGHRPGLVAAGFLATGAVFEWYARSGGIDLALTFCTTLTVACFLRSQVFPTRWAVGWQILGGAALAMAGLAKGPIGFSVPLLPILAWFLVGTRIAPTPSSPATRRVGWPLALLTLGIVLVPWCMMILHKVPNALSLANQEIRDNIFRSQFFPGDATSAHEPWYYYAGTIAAFAPWGMFFPAACESLVGVFRQWNKAPRDRGVVFVWLWFGLNLIAFSAVHQKKAYYFLPCLPALALLLGDYWHTQLGTHPTETWGRRRLFLPALWGCLGLLVTLGAAFAVLSGPRVFSSSTTARGVAGAGVFILAGALSAAWCLRQRRFTAVLMHLLALTYVLHMVGIIALLPLDNAYRSRKTFFHTIAPVVQAHPLYAYRYGRYDAPFYLQRIIPFLERPPELQALFARPERLFVIIPEEAYETHPVQGMVTVVDQSWTAPAGFPGRQRLLLVSNR